MGCGGGVYRAVPSLTYMDMEFQIIRTEYYAVAVSVSREFSYSSSVKYCNMAESDQPTVLPLGFVVSVFLYGAACGCCCNKTGILASGIFSARNDSQ